MFVFGIMMALLGAVLPVLSERLRFDLAQTGGLFLAMNLCMLLASLGLGPLMDRLGMKPPLLAGPMAVGVALLVIAFAEAYATLLWGVALLGAGGGALNSATNTLMADLHADSKRKNSALNLLGVFFGFGALFLPFVIGSLLERLGLRNILCLAAAFCAVVALGAGVLVFPAPKQRSGAGFAGVLRLVRVPLVLALGLLLFFESGNEFILGGYISTYLTREIHSPLSTASYLLAAFWGAIMICRALLSRILLHIEGHRLVLLSAGCSAAGAALLVSAPGVTAGAAGVLLLGFGLAGIYPTTLGLAGSHFQEHSGTVFGILFTIALTGGMTMPWAVGRIANASGLRAGLSLVVMNFLIILALEFAVPRLARRKTSEEEAKK
jgi:fucose permease